MARGTKRRPDVPKAARAFGEIVTKAELLEAGLHLAALCSGAGADDHKAALRRLAEEVHNGRERRRERHRGDLAEYLAIPYDPEGGA